MGTAGLTSENLYMERKTDWYAEWFNEDYLATYPHRTEKDARDEASFVCKSLGLGPGDLVLDLCCGTGRHMAGLAKARCRVIGMDLSMALLRHARERMESAALVRGDMRDLPFHPGFDGVLTFFSSFGYFENDDDNFDVLAEIARLLHSGGVYMLDLMHASHVRKHLVPVTTRTVGDMEIKEERSIDEDNRRVNKRIEIERDGETRTYRESVRMYGLQEIVAAGVLNGLIATDAFGDFFGAEFSEDSPRMIVTGVKL